ncbi:LOW QUALITY PROTEIN: hypothetical protein PanWU01x14_153140 [Parasponia andersonii]|uniref:Uncharacterized protein n=1 Tax=Parasponia andersonii TaxID=3476 RepID=A0A2P5CH28_PARAD|nr:LOW QUALITY PROTEIN: hypothetical protein PanWU01x14_153140 [Parasponia andersonii]
MCYILNLEGFLREKKKKKKKKVKEGKEIYTLRCIMTIYFKEVQVIVQSEDKSWLSPKRHIKKVVFLGYHGLPSEESVGHQARYRRIGRFDTSDEFIHVSRKNMQVTLQVLLHVQVPVEAQRKTVTNRFVPDVEPGVAGRSEDINVVVLGADTAGDLVVDNLSVDEGDGEALRCQLDRQVYGGDDVALERDGENDGV